MFYFLEKDSIEIAIRKSTPYHYQKEKTNNPARMLERLSEQKAGRHIAPAQEVNKFFTIIISGFKTVNGSIPEMLAKNNKIYCL